MAIRATRMDTDMAHWADGTVHYSTDDGRYWAIEAFMPDCCHVVPQGATPMISELLAVLGEGEKAVKHVVRPTVVFECTAEGMPIDLTPVMWCGPKDTHADALTAMGFEHDEHDEESEELEGEDGGTEEVH